MTKACQFTVNTLKLYFFTIVRATCQLVALLSVSYNTGYTQMLESASARLSEGQYRAAITDFEQFIQQNPRRSYDQSVAWLGISQAWLQLGDYEQALAANSRSLAIRQQIHADDQAENHLQYAFIHLQTGAYEHALSYLRIAKAMPVLVNPALFAQMDLCAAEAWKGLENHAEAERYYLSALEGLSAELGDFHPDVAEALYRLGLLYQRMRRHNDAKETLLRALRAADSHDTPSTAGRVALALGETLWAETGQATSARAYFYAALHDAEAAPQGLRQIQIARARLWLSRAAWAAGEYTDAAAHIQQAQYALCPGFTADDFAAHPASQQPWLDPLLGAEVLAQKARCITSQRLPGALQCYENMLQLLEQECTRYRDDATRLHLLRLLPPVAEAAIAVAMQADAPQQAFVWAERAKAAWQRAQLAAPAQKSVEKSLLLNWREAELDFRLAPQDTILQRRWLMQQQAYTDWSTQQQIRQSIVQTTRVEDVQTRLDPQTVLLAYFLGEQALYIFGVSREAFQARTLPLKQAQSHADHLAYGRHSAATTTRLEEDIAACLHAIEQSDPAAFVLSAQALYQQLVQPVSALLSRKKRLIIAPHGALVQLPFEVLLHKPAGNKVGRPSFHRMAYLAKNYTVTYRLSAGKWASPPSRATWPISLAAFAPVLDYDISTQQDGAVWLDTLFRRAVDPSAVHPATLRFTALPGSDAEVERIAASWLRPGEGRRVFLRQEATEEAVRQVAGHTRILYLATHGFRHPFNTQYSGLWLRPQGLDDGFLTLGEIQAMDWQDALCVWHLAESGASHKAQSETAQLLAASFLGAGAGAVVGNLLPEPYPSQLFSLWHGLLAGGESAEEALRLAQRVLLKDKATAVPRRWAALRVYVR